MSIPLGSIASGYQRGLTTSQGVLSPAQIKDYQTQLLLLLAEIQKSKNTLAQAEVDALSSMEKERASFELELIKQYVSIYKTGIEKGAEIEKAKIAHIASAASKMYFATADEFARKIQRNSVDLNTAAVGATNAERGLPGIVSALKAEGLSEGNIKAEIGAGLDNYIKATFNTGIQAYAGIQGLVKGTNIMDKGSASRTAKRTVAGIIRSNVKIYLDRQVAEGTLVLPEGLTVDAISRVAFDRTVEMTDTQLYLIDRPTESQAEAAFDKEHEARQIMLNSLEKRYGANASRAMKGALDSIGYQAQGPENMAESLIALREARVQQDPVTQFLTDKLMEQYNAADDLGKDDFDRQSERIQALPLYNELTMALGLNNKYQVASFVGSSPQALRQAYRALEDSAQREYQRKLIEAAQAGEVLPDINRPKDIIATYRNNPALVQQALGSQLGVKETPFQIKSALRQKARTEMIDLPALMGLTEEVAAEEVAAEEAPKKVPAPRLKQEPVFKTDEEAQERIAKMTGGEQPTGTPLQQRALQNELRRQLGQPLLPVDPAMDAQPTGTPLQQRALQNELRRQLGQTLLPVDPAMLPFEQIGQESSEATPVYQFKATPSVSEDRFRETAAEKRALQTKGLEYRLNPKTKAIEYRFRWKTGSTWKEVKSTAAGGSREQDQAYRYSKRAMRGRPKSQGLPSSLAPISSAPTTDDTPFSIEGIPMAPRSMQGSDPFKQYE